MSLEELYQDTILDHSRAPRNQGALSTATHHATGNNPICGDRVTIYIQSDGDKAKKVQFVGEGCAISKASASLMSEHFDGRSAKETREMFSIFQKMVTGKEISDSDKKLLGKLTVFSGVGEFPARVKCATLAWHTFFEALESTDKAQPATNTKK
jgi:nitrogen fixation NifU-like protein